MAKIEGVSGGFVDLIDVMGSDLTVVNAARVSFGKRKDKFDEKDSGLIRYLAKHNHWTPFGHPQITLHIKAPIPIRTQFFKHKQGFVENEISRRYVDVPPEFFFPESFRPRSEDRKQGSADGDMGQDRHQAACSIYEHLIHQSAQAYGKLIVLGVCPEQARFILPQAMFTEWYWTGSLAAYARFYKLRSQDDAQWEIRQYAETISTVVAPLFPVSWKALTS